MKKAGNLLKNTPQSRAGAAGCAAPPPLVQVEQLPVMGVLSFHERILLGPRVKARAGVEGPYLRVGVVAPESGRHDGGVGQDLRRHDAPR